MKVMSITRSSGNTLSIIKNAPDSYSVCINGSEKTFYELRDAINYFNILCGEQNETTNIITTN